MITKMSATEVDFIVPKYSPFVTITDAYPIPATTALSIEVTGASVAVTLTGTAYAFGNLTVMQLHALSFTGAASHLTASIATSGLSLPAATIRHPCINLLNATTETGYLSIDSAGAVTIYATAAGGVFSANAATLYAQTVTYASS